MAERGELAYVASRMQKIADLRAANKQLAAELADTREALRKVLEWPLPHGPVEMHALPGWLADIARAALAVDQKEET